MREKSFSASISLLDAVGCHKSCRGIVGRILCRWQSGVPPARIFVGLHYVPARSASYACRVIAKCRASGTKALPPDGVTLAILAESNRYAADMYVIALLQAKACSSLMRPALCASHTLTGPCVL